MILFIRNHIYSLIFGLLMLLFITAYSWVHMYEGSIKSLSYNNGLIKINCDITHYYYEEKGNDTITTIIAMAEVTNTNSHNIIFNYENLYLINSGDTLNIIERYNNFIYKPLVDKIIRPYHKYREKIYWQYTKYLSPEEILNMALYYKHYSNAKIRLYMTS